MVSFDRQRGNGTGSVYYDGWSTHPFLEFDSESDDNLFSFQLFLVTETDTLNHNITHITAKVCTTTGPFLEHEKRTIDALWKKAGATINAMVAHSLPFYYCEGFVGDYSVLFLPKVEMTLEDMLRNPVLPDHLLAHQKEMLLIMLQTVRF